MKNLLKIAVAAVVLATSTSALADPIEVVALTDGAHPATLGGLVMTPFAAPADGMHTCTSSPSGGQVCFDDGTGTDTLVSLEADNPTWWQYDGTPAPVHGNIFVVVDRNLIDLILPPNTRGFSLFVGASGRGNAWIKAYDDQGNSTSQVNFGVNNGDTKGYGVYTTGCNAITRITVEPFQWGFGYFSSNESECTAVPEPAPIALLGLGLLGIALMRRVTVRRERV